jgi:hypothetical protein
MNELDDWATETGYRHSKPSLVGEWLDQHPDRQAQIVEARERGWSWKAVCTFLRSKGFPYTANPLQAACQQRGIR